MFVSRAPVVKFTLDSMSELLLPKTTIFHLPIMRYFSQLLFLCFEGLFFARQLGGSLSCHVFHQFAQIIIELLASGTLSLVLFEGDCEFLHIAHYNDHVDFFLTVKQDHYGQILIHPVLSEIVR